MWLVCRWQCFIKKNGAQCCCLHRWAAQIGGIPIGTRTPVGVSDELIARQTPIFLNMHGSSPSSPLSKLRCPSTPFATMVSHWSMDFDNITHGDDARRHPQGVILIFYHHLRWRETWVAGDVVRGCSFRTERASSYRASDVHTSRSVFFDTGNMCVSVCPSQG